MLSCSSSFPFLFLTGGISGGIVDLPQGPTFGCLFALPQNHGVARSPTSKLGQQQIFI